jgi:dTDP-4-dehydrorhamnose 3,5-epimerase
VNFQTTDIPGLVVITTDVSTDIRGAFSRIHSRDEFAAGGIDPDFEQCSLSYNRARATVRGLHYQVEPYVEAKLVCCVAGSIFDAVVDLRRDSPGFGRAWWGTLAADRGISVYVPKGCAHGFQTLEDGAALL